MKYCSAPATQSIGTVNTIFVMNTRRGWRYELIQLYQCGYYPIACNAFLIITILDNYGVLICGDDAVWSICYWRQFVAGFCTRIRVVATDKNVRPWTVVFVRSKYVLIVVRSIAFLRLLSLHRSGAHESTKPSLPLGVILGMANFLELRFCLQRQCTWWSR